MRHQWFRDAEPRHCAACGKTDCTGRIAVEFCLLWQDAQGRSERGEFLMVQSPYLRYGPTIIRRSGVA